MIRGVLVAVLLAGCGGTGASSETDDPECGEPAPTFIVTTIEDGMATDASLADAYVTEATELSGIPLFDLPQWAQPWWVIGRLNGTPDTEQSGIWVTNNLDESEGGILLAVNHGARQNSNWGADVDAAIGGRGTEDHKECLGLE